MKSLCRILRSSSVDKKALAFVTTGCTQAKKEPKWRNITLFLKWRSFYPMGWLRQWVSIKEYDFLNQLILQQRTSSYRSKTSEMLICITNIITNIILSLILYNVSLILSFLENGLNSRNRRWHLKQNIYCGNIVVHLISNQMRIHHQKKQKTTGTLTFSMVWSATFISAQRLIERLIRFSNKVFFYMFAVYPFNCCLNYEPQWWVYT